jgi:hypothetical protein
VIEKAEPNGFLGTALEDEVRSRGSMSWWWRG